MITMKDLTDQGKAFQCNDRRVYCAFLFISYYRLKGRKVWSKWGLCIPENEFGDLSSLSINLYRLLRLNIITEIV